MTKIRISMPMLFIAAIQYDRLGLATQITVFLFSRSAKKLVSFGLLKI